MHQITGLVFSIWIRTGGTIGASITKHGLVDLREHLPRNGVRFWSGGMPEVELLQIAEVES